jgi:hypothetical protein
LVDFGILFHQCSAKDFLRKMKRDFSFQQPVNQIKNEDAESKKIKIVGEKEITCSGLVRYLHKRRIPLGIATKFCKETDYELYGKK